MKRASPPLRENANSASISPPKIIQDVPAEPIRYTTSLFLVIFSLKAKMLNIAVRNGTKVYKVPVFNGVVVFKASNIQIKKTEKNTLIIRLLGSALIIPFLYCALNSTKGNNVKAAITNLSKVNEKGLTTPDNFSDEINEPATNNVTNSANRWYLT